MKKLLGCFVILALMITAGGLMTACDGKLSIYNITMNNSEDYLFETDKELAQEGQTMLIVTHQLNAVSHFATKVAFLNNGKIEVEGNCEEVFHKSDNPNLNSFLRMVEFGNL